MLCGKKKQSTNKNQEVHFSTDSLEKEKDSPKVTTDPHFLKDTQWHELRVGPTRSPS